jgi:XTP/dITP diphosphohydrolase
MPKTILPGTRLVIASHNPGKVREFGDLLSPFGLVVISAGELGLPEPEETETTFTGNARLKARAAARAAKLPALSDDSGLEIEMLGGAPGIYSARWAGDDKNFQRAMQRVHDEIAKTCGGWPDEAPVANFTCALCMAWPDGTSEVFEGKVFGKLVWPPSGDNGFGYDPMFLPDGDIETFGEMEPGRKHAMSHRARAFELLRQRVMAG